MSNPSEQFFIAGLGANVSKKFALQQINEGNCAGILDDGLAGNNFYGCMIRPITHLQLMDRQCRVVVSIFNPEPASLVFSKIIEFGHMPIFLESFVVEKELDKNIIGFPDYAMVDDLLDVADAFHDNLSARTVDAIRKYWKTGERAYLYSVSQAPDSIYFNEAFLPECGNHTYVDVGAFDGDTFRSFINYYPGFDSAELFEPIIDIDQLTLPANVKVHKCALGDKRTETTFAVDGLNSRPNKDGGVSVAIKQLDEFKLSPTFLKIDAEGFDLAVLVGAKRTIKMHQPIIALSVYHKPEHLLEGIILLRDTFGYSKFYLRKYSPSNDETVLYAVK